MHDKQNYGPVSTLSNLSKVFELRLIHIGVIISPNI